VSIKEWNNLGRYRKGFLCEKRVSKREENKFKAKYGPVGILLKCLRYDIFLIFVKLKYTEKKILLYSCKFQ